MPHYAPVHFSYERDCERLGSAQCGNDELLRVIADRQSLERCDRDLGDDAGIGVCLTSDQYLVRWVNSCLGRSWWSTRIR